MENLQQRSITSIIRNKVLDKIEQSTLSACIRNVFLFFAACLMIFILNNPQATAQRFRSARENNSFVMISSVVSFYVFMNLGRIMERITTIEFNRYQESDHSDRGAVIEGIPVIELIDHLFFEKSFKREEIEKKFGIARHRFTEFANALESIGILVRGENNARVLNNEITKQEIVACLSEAKEIEDIKKKPIRVGESEYNFNNIGTTIQQRVADILHPSDQ